MTDDEMADLDSAYARKLKAQLDMAVAALEAIPNERLGLRMLALKNKALTAIQRKNKT